MFEACTNSKKQGYLGLGVAIGWFCQNGYVVNIPLTDSQEYDLVVDNGQGLKKGSGKDYKHHRKKRKVRS
jgi:hypothetical protein